MVGEQDPSNPQPDAPSILAHAVRIVAEHVGSESERAYRAAQEAWTASVQAYAAYQLEPPGPENDRARRAFMQAMNTFLQRVRELTAALDHLQLNR